MRDLVETLRAYAASPRDDAPPEILPPDSADPWGLDGAARTALGLLLDADQPSELLCATADYLLTFFSGSLDGRPSSDALLLNGTALALCGYLCDGAHPEAELWRVTGGARLATEVHARRAALDDQVAADCLLAVCRAADKLELPILADLVTLRERMWGRLLDHSRAERLHVAEEDYPLHLMQAAAAEEVGELMRGREWQRQVCLNECLAEADLEAADGACENLITLRAHMLVRHQFGSEIDWGLRLFDDVESTVSLGCQSFIRNLAAAYAQTGDEKYARHAARLLWSFYRVSPLPNHKQLQGPWRTLEVGNRQCNVWPDVIALLGRTEAFDAETHAMLARSRLDHMRYLLAYCGYGNNWYQVESAGLATAALFSPELRHADTYLRVALRRLKWINSFAYYDDGFQFELTPGYHMFPTNSMFAVVRTARARGVQLPEDFIELIEKAHQMYVYAVQPDHTLPMLNDNGPQPVDPASILGAAATVFARPDFQWASTYGEAGQPPDHASHAWPSAGYYVMRDEWGEDGQYLFFDAAAWGASHQHDDKLSFVLCSHGRPLIGDPNIYSYAPTELTRYFKSPRAHNVVMVDGKGQTRAHRPEAKVTTLGQTEWVTRERFDFVSSEYLEGWSADGRDIDSTLSHRRAIFYVKPGYWILCDLIRGDDQTPHTLEQLLHITPIHCPSADVPIQAGAVSTSPAAILTEDPGLANLAVLPVDTNGLVARAQKGETSPAVGWYGVLGEFPAWDVTLACSRTLPGRLDAVLFPLAPGESRYPTVSRLRTDAAVSAFRIIGHDLDDTFVLCEEEAGPVTVGDITFEGRALLLRRKPGTQALAVGARSLSVEGADLDVEA